MSSSTITTARVATSRMPSMPLNELAESAALPSGPAMYTASPAGPARAMSRRLVAAADAWFQPDEPRLTGTKVSTAFPSLDTRPRHLRGDHPGHLGEPRAVGGHFGQVGAGQAGRPV